MTHRDRGGNLLELAELTALEHSAPSAGAWPGVRPEDWGLGRGRLGLPAACQPVLGCWALRGSPPPRW